MNIVEWSVIYQQADGQVFIVDVSSGSITTIRHFQKPSFTSGAIVSESVADFERNMQARGRKGGRYVE